MQTVGVAFIFLTVLGMAAPPAFAAWTELPLGPSGRAVYVSSSQGDNANDGLSEASPKATIAAGFALLRDHHGDHLLLRRGDSFTLSPTLVWWKSGASAEEPIVLGAYGDAWMRPVIDTGLAEALHISPGFRSANTVRHLAIVGVQFRSAQRDFNRRPFDLATTPTNGGLGIRIVGVQTTAPQIVEDLLIEGCQFEFLEQPLVLEGPYSDSVQDVRVRRNQFVDTYSTRGDPSALYVANVNGFLMEENLIDGVQRAPGLDPARTTSALAHAVYVQSTSRDVTLRDNIFARAYDGGMVRPGGVYEGNLVMDVTLGHHEGYMYYPSSLVHTEGIEARVAGNAFLKVGANNAINAGNLRHAVIEGNVILSGPTTGGSGIWLIGMTYLDQVGVHDVLVQDNYVLGLRGLTAFGPSISDVAVRHNQFRAASTEVLDLSNYEAGDYAFAGNAYLSQRPANAWFRIDGFPRYGLAGWIAFAGEPDATAASSVDPAAAPDIESYQASIGREPTMAAFLDKARRQWQRHWGEEYTAAAVISYLRGQLGL
jgi:hypothetical protein